MGKRMDTAVLFLVCLLIMFVLFLFTGKDIRIVSVISAISALCLCVILKSVYMKMKSKSVRRRKNGFSKQVKSLIYKENADALNETIALLQKKYNLHSISFEGGRMYFRESASEDQYELQVIRKFKASPDDILSIWRDSRKKKPVKGILFLIPGKMDQDIKLLRYKIDQPEILVFDSNALKMLYRKYGQAKNESFQEKKARPVHLIKTAINRKRALRYLAYALLLTGYYLVSGNLLYLTIGAFLTFMCLFSFFSNVKSDQLFF